MSKKSKFSGPVVLVSSNNRKKPFQVYLSFSFDSSVLKRKIFIPEGFQTDLASVPRLLWSWFPPTGLYKSASVVHDFLCVNKICNWINADRVFLEAMKETDLHKWERGLLFMGVLLFGPVFAAGGGHLKPKRKKR